MCRACEEENPIEVPGTPERRELIEQVLTGLAKLPPIEYEDRRHEFASALGWRVTQLDLFVKERQQK